VPKPITSSIDPIGRSAMTSGTGSVSACRPTKLVEHHRLRIVGSAYFVKHGRTYIDATHPVRFVPG